MKSRKFFGIVAVAAALLVAFTFRAEAQQWVCGPNGCYQVSAPSYSYAAPAYSYAAQPVFFGGGYMASSCNGGGYSATYAAPSYSSCNGGGGGYSYAVPYAAGGYSSCGGGGGGDGGYSYVPTYRVAQPYYGGGFGFGARIGW